MARRGSVGYKLLLVQGIIGLTFLALIIGAIGFGIAAKFQKNDYTVTISEKGERCQTKDSCVYLIYTDKGVFSNTDSLIDWKFDSADYYNDIKVGKVYHIQTRGMRVAFLSMYENIYKFKEVE
ncbi:hypothetical protein [Pseudomonas phage Astolliot]|nr:hypothetical protein [Pseudomonas phage Astolliot]